MIAKVLVAAIGISLCLMAGEGCRGDSQESESRFLGRQESWDYAAAMRKVAEKFRGTEGVVLHVGDSITYASPYTAWARAGEGKKASDEAVLRWSHCGAEDDRDGWYLAHFDLPKGRSFTAAGGIRSDQYIAGGFKGMPSLEEIIRKYNPQVAVVMLGTNDAWQNRTVEEYTPSMETIVSRLLGNGTVVILSTIPPLIVNPELAEQHNQALWELARKHSLPVIDYYGEILARRPGMTWDGTLLERGDPHPTAEMNGVTPTSPPTAGNLRESGYLLRGWLSVRKLAEVKQRVFDAE